MVGPIISIVLHLYSRRCKRGSEISPQKLQHIPSFYILLYRFYQHPRYPQPLRHHHTATTARYRMVPSRYRCHVKHKQQKEEAKLIYSVFVTPVVLSPALQHAGGNRLGQLPPPPVRLLVSQNHAPLCSTNRQRQSGGRQWRQTTVTRKRPQQGRQATTVTTVTHST